MDSESGRRNSADTRDSKKSRLRHLGKRRAAERYAALDLGTNNCRLLIASPRGKKLRIIDAFSQIVRLGEGVSGDGGLSAQAMDRAIDALLRCAEKIDRRRVTHLRCIATAACRVAENGAEFLKRVEDETGLKFEIIDAQEEARLAVSGCHDLIDQSHRAALIFDIGGGSTEISWLTKTEQGQFKVASWMSMPIGVVNLSERWNGFALTDEAYEQAVLEARTALRAFGDPSGIKSIFEEGQAHLLGTSGTVTSIAGVHLGLTKYRREKVDGAWLTDVDVHTVTTKLRGMTFEERADQACIGRERADLVVCGCAILDALLREWPVSKVRVADRGLREGILNDLAAEAKRKRRQRRRR